MTVALRLAISQMPAILQDTAANMATAVRLSTEAARQGARLILLPEGCLTGTALCDPARQAGLPCHPEAFAPLSDVARRHGITICAGFATAFHDGFNIVHAIVSPQDVRFQHKAARASTEPEFVAPWPDPARTVFDVDGARVLVMICSEGGSPLVLDAVAAAKPDLVLHPSAGRMKDEEVLHPGAPTDPAAIAFDENCRAVVERAARNVRTTGIPRACANPVGFDGEVWWPGNAYAVSAEGSIVLWLKGENRPERMIASVGVADMPLRKPSPRPR